MVPPGSKFELPGTHQRAHGFPMLVIVVVAVVAIAALIWMKKANPSTDSGFPDPSAELDLLRMVHRDEAKAERLIQGEIARNPRLTRRRAAQRARDRLRYVRGR
jgi:hypothetical protein